MKNILFATTALVATAGIAAADVTFSGSGEAGIYRTGKVEAAAAKFGTKVVASSVPGTDTADTSGKLAIVNYDANGVLKVTAADLVKDSDSSAVEATAADAAEVRRITRLIIKEKGLLAADEKSAAEDAALGTDAGDIAAANHTDDATAHKAQIARLEAELAVATGTAAVKAVKAGDMTAYSGYQADVTLSTETDSGIKFTMGFDLEAGLMADKDDDLEMDTKDGSIANSTLTMEANGYTLVIGQDEIDDLYDDSQNGDISLSGEVGGLSFTVVHDFEDSVLAKAATYKAESGEADIISAAGVIGDDSATDDVYTAAVFTDAVAAVNEGTSVKLGYTMGNATLGLVATSANDRNNSANKISLGYTVSDTLSFTVAHDSQGQRDAITSASVTYAIDALTITAKYADDKNHAGNTNKNGKASTDLSIGYAQGPISATFATNESSEWEVITSYDLGGGAAAFATVDHSEFAVAGLSFAF